MARTVHVILTCDLHDGDERAIETVAFGYDGYSYTFELCEQHLAEFNQAMQHYVAAARRDRKPLGRRSTTVGEPTRVIRASRQEVRNWAKRQGLEISARGRIDSKVEAAFNQAHQIPPVR
jgi:Lsr2